MDKPRRTILALAGAIAIIATACGGSASPSPSPAGTATRSAAATATATPKPPADNVTMLTDFLLFGWHSPLFAGKAEGFYTEQNINVTIEAGKGSADGATKVAAGTAQFGQLDATSALTAIGKGADLVLIGAYFKKYPGGMCFIQEKKQIKAWKDMEGLKIGAAAGDAYMVALPSLMTQFGADYKKVNVITMDAAATTPALVSGQVDGTPCGLPTFPSRASAAEKQNLHMNYFLFGDNGFDALGFVLVTSGKLAKQNPDLVQRVTNAWAKSAVWSLANQDKAVADFLAANRDKDKAAETSSFTGVKPLIKGSASTYFVFDTAQVQKTVDFVNQAYSVSLKVSDVYTNQFVDKLPSSYKQGALQ